MCLTFIYINNAVKNYIQITCLILKYEFYTLLLLIFSIDLHVILVLLQRKTNLAVRLFSFRWFNMAFW